MIPPEDYYKSLPKKRMGSGALFFNNERNFLIVKPTYKEVWEIPGGVVEDNESPRQGAEREIKEEINLNKHVTQLLCIDYQDAVLPKTESIMFIFDGGILEYTEIMNIKLQSSELSDYRFVDEKQASMLLSQVLFRRVQQALIAKDKNMSVYLENRELPL